MTKVIINCETGEVTERELNKAEKDQQKIDTAQFEAEQAVKQAEAEAKAIAKSAILDRIGLTADEFKTILG
jgi:F0F1-type ATP synthase membrane subunit b/b'